ncbi:hypothetical protein [Pseudanabaena sp. PCC 6802]|uniref:hypothetical protein n=1 Tax=Pseudanabaena sp. PCC 6802 TaxID=118173 RepID=UPI00034D79E0|nr:hypothetical protein [Pseudanabaena sp. PCC 6802]
MEPFFEVFVVEDLVEKALPIALSFVDDLLVLALPNFGLPLPDLQWLSPVCLAWTVIYLGLKRWRKLSEK